MTNFPAFRLYALRPLTDRVERNRDKARQRSRRAELYLQAHRRNTRWTSPSGFRQILGLHRIEAV